MLVLLLVVSGQNGKRNQQCYEQHWNVVDNTVAVQWMLETQFCCTNSARGCISGSYNWTLESQFVSFQSVGMSTTKGLKARTKFRAPLCWKVNIRERIRFYHEGGVIIQQQLCNSIDPAVEFLTLLMIKAALGFDRAVVRHCFSK